MTVFADSYFYLAILSADDEGHSKAIDFSRGYHGQTITTEWVLMEVADALASPRTRGSVSILYQGLRNNPKVTIVPAEHISFERGMDLYCNRPDKGWSLTDCISFEVMREHGVTEALTGDRHFAQAGFTPVFAI